MFRKTLFHKTLFHTSLLQMALALMAVVCVAACTPQTTETPVDNSSVTLEKLAENVWLHTSFYEFPGGAKVPSNGIAVKDGDTLILVDTAWGEIATQTLAAKLKAETGLDISKVVITHFHYDRLAGVDWLEAQGATVFTHPDTAAKSAALGTPVPNTSVAELAEPHARTALGPLEIAYPGPGHTEDNLVVYVKDANILFGGCAVRAANHTSMGNVADANLSAWGPSLAWVKAVYKDTQIVVPSHGAAGNAKLLDHTLGLLAKTVNAQAEGPKSDSQSEPAEAP